MISRRNWLDLRWDLPSEALVEISAFEGVKINSTRLSDPVYRARLVRAIHSVPRKDLSNPKDTNYTRRNLEEIAHFLNPSPLDWSPSQIQEGHQYLWGVLEEDQISPDFEYGPITPEKTRRIDLITLVTLLQRYQVRIDSSSEERVRSLRHYLSRTREDLKVDLIKKIDHLSKSSLFNLLVEKENISNRIWDSDKLQKAYQEIDQDKVPQDSYQAIVLGAIKDKVDLTSQSDPFSSYQYLSDHPEFKKNLPSLRRFNPNLPRCFYSDLILQEIALRMGSTCKQIQSEDPYQLCLEGNRQDHFIEGRNRPYLNSLTPIFQLNPDQVDSDQLLSFGCPKKGYRIYTCSELTQMFNYHHELLRPDLGTPFQNYQVRSLKYIVSSTLYPNQEDSDKHQLDRTISKILASRSTRTEAEKELIQAYSKTPIEVRRALELVKELGMYMRGWKGVGEYPVVQTDTPELKKCFSLVWEAIRRLEEFISSAQLPVILQLPIYRYCEGRFILNQDPERGLSLGERIKIVQYNRNGHACIRNTSNWILWSVYRYWGLLKSKPDFEIDFLRKID